MRIAGNPSPQLPDGIPAGVGARRDTRTSDHIRLAFATAPEAIEAGLAGMKKFLGG